MVPGERAAVPQGDPDVPVVVDGQPVRYRVRRCDVHDRAPAAEVAGGRVEVEGVDVGGAAIGQVHGRAVGAPADPVGDGQAGQHLRAAAVEVQPVQAASAGCLVVGHGAGPEPALRVTRPVVHPDVGAAGF